MQTSTTLGAQDWIDAAPAASVFIAPIIPADGTERATFSFTPPNASRWFARVKIDVLP